MRFRTSLIVGFLVTILILMVAVVSANRDVLSRDFNLLGTHMPTSVAFLLALMVGFLSFLVWFAASGLSQLGTRWLQRLQDKGERRAEESYLKGLDAVLGGRPHEAISHFNKALEPSPRYLPALLKLGDTYRSVDKIDDAVACHRKALEGYPQDLPTLYALLEDYLAQRNHSEAKKVIQQILRIQPRRSLKALRTLRNLYIQEANWQSALEVQEKIGAARVLDEERADDEPFTQGILYQIGVDSLDQEKHKEAISQLEKVRKKFPEFIPTYLTLAEAYLLQGREEDAVATWLDGYRQANAPECLLAMEKMYLDKGDPEGAVRQYQRLVTEIRRKAIPKFLLGRLYYRLELLDKAHATFKEVEGVIGDSGLLQFYLGRIHQRRGDAEGACKHYRSMIRILNPFELLFRCGSCGEQTPDWQGYCSVCHRWGTFHPEFKDEMMQEIQATRPIYQYWQEPR